MAAPFDAGGPDARFPFPAYPNGWARIALSEDLAPGDVVPLRYFGREWVAFRARSGPVRVLDAHCPHLGAHLGRGGEVVGDTLRCPFHHWRFDGDGRCVEVPYARRIPPRANASAWPTCERNGFVFVWYHGDGLPPDEEVPELPEVSDPEWSDFTRLRWKIRGRDYDMGENTVDDVHFHYLHGAASMPSTDRGDLLGARSVRSRMKMQSPDGLVDAAIENTSVPGMGIVKLSGICDTLIVITSAPVDGLYVDQMFSYSQRTGGDPRLEKIGRAFLRDLEKQMNEDIVCFENKRYWIHPLLVEEDGAIADYRRRSRARYTGRFPEASDAAEWDGGPAPVARSLAPPKPRGFCEREFRELESFLRSTFRARRVERREAVGAEGDDRIEFHLFGRGDEPKHIISFERGCLERNEVADLRGYLARPLVRRRVASAGVERFDAPSEEID
jgi:nitrite reductase/ring-hydroxylating ferredoxin subunit